MVGGTNRVVGTAAVVGVASVLLGVTVVEVELVELDTTELVDSSMVVGASDGATVGVGTLVVGPTSCVSEARLGTSTPSSPATGTVPSGPSATMSASPSPT